MHPNTTNIFVIIDHNENSINNIIKLTYMTVVLNQVRLSLSVFRLDDFICHLIYIIIR
jgi:hypothetical protein